MLWLCRKWFPQHGRALNSMMFSNGPERNIALFKDNSVPLAWKLLAGKRRDGVLTAKVTSGPLSFCLLCLL